MKKKLMALLLTAVMLCSIFAVPAQAAQYKVGDAIGNVLYTDIVTYIDGYAIRSYNINGYTYIVAEDLLMYGFSVVWNGVSKTLTIYPTRTAAPADYTADYTPTAAGGKVGEPAMPYLYTDVVTYIGSEKITSYNIGGFTCICIDDLAQKFAQGYVWDPTARTLKMTSPAFGPSIPTKPVDPEVDDKDDEEDNEKDPGTTGQANGAEAAFKRVVKNWFNEYIDIEVGVSGGKLNARVLEELTALSSLYGDETIAQFTAVLTEIYSTYEHEVTEVRRTDDGAEIDVTITMRDLSTALTDAMSLTMTEVSIAIMSGKTLTEEELAAVMMQKLLLVMGDDYRRIESRDVTVYVDIDFDDISFSAYQLNEEKNDDFINALIGGLLSDPMLANINF